MIAKCLPYPARPRAADRAFAARMDYILAPATCALAVNLLGDPAQDRDLILRQFLIAAATKPRVQHPLCEIVVTVSETQTLSDAALLGAGQRLLILIDAARLQAVLAVHRNTASPHMHIIVNRVPPTGGRAYDRRHLGTALEWACRQIEVEQGWPQDRGRFDTELVEGTVRLVPKSAAHWAARQAARDEGLRLDSQNQKRRNGQRGLSSLRDLLPQKILHRLAQSLDAARSWADVAQSCAQEGLRYVRVRGGAHLVRLSDKAWMLASQLGTRFGFSQMCKRLGPFAEPFVPTRPRTAIRHVLRGPVSSHQISALRAAIAALPARDPARLSTEARRRRYQAAFRKPTGPDQPTTVRITDITAARQLWMMRNFLVLNQADPSLISSLACRFPDDLVSLGSDRLLVPLRSDGSGLSGFLHLSRRPSGAGAKAWRVTEVAGGSGGFASIGPATAQNIWLLPDPVCLPDLLEDMIDMPEPVRIVTASRHMSLAGWTRVLHRLGDLSCAVITPAEPPADWKAAALCVRPHLPFLALSDLQAVPKIDAAFGPEPVENDPAPDNWPEGGGTSDRCDGADNGAMPYDDGPGS